MEQLNNLKYCNFIGYSDVEPFEVVRVVSDKCIEIRALKAVQDLSVKPHFDIGGFSAHSDNKQKWNIFPDPDAKVIRVRKSKSLCDGYFKDKYGHKYKLSDHPVKFYDYKF